MPSAKHKRASCPSGRLLLTRRPMAAGDATLSGGLTARIIIRIDSSSRGRKNFRKHCSRFVASVIPVQWLRTHDSSVDEWVDEHGNVERRPAVDPWLDSPYVFDVSGSPAALEAIAKHDVVTAVELPMAVRIGVLACGAGEVKQRGSAPRVGKCQPAPQPVDRLGATDLWPQWSEQWTVVEMYYE